MDDDFTTQEIKGDEKNKSAKSKDGSVKPKKGPKIVNFDQCIFGITMSLTKSQVHRDFVETPRV